MNPPRAIAGSEKVIAALGGWPSFHDAEVLAFELERSCPAASQLPETRMKIHVRQYESRNEGTAEYHLALVKNVVITFRFTGLEALEVRDFNHQNVIDGLAVHDAPQTASAKLVVEVPSIFGFGGQWQCQSAEVTNVTHGPSEA
jgi:hypothetical protein